MHGEPRGPGAMPALTITPVVTREEFTAMRQHAAEEYPRECCGLVLVRGGTRLLRRCRNIQDELHRMDPIKHPRTAAKGYAISPEILTVLRDGWRIAVIYHSHTQGGDQNHALSADDVLAAVRHATPAYPGVHYVVLGMGAGRVERAAAYQWSRAGRAFELGGFAFCVDDDGFRQPTVLPLVETPATRMATGHADSPRAGLGAGRSAGLRAPVRSILTKSHAWLWRLDTLTAAMTLLAMWLVSERLWWGWGVGLANQGLWTCLIVRRRLWGLAPLTVALIVIYIRALILWGGD